MPKLTARQDRFCQEYMKCLNGTEAARLAGYSERTCNEQAAQIMARPHVKAEIKRMQDELAAAANVTVRSLLAEAEEARAEAKRVENPAAMVSATTLKAKLTSNLVEKHEDIVERDRLAAEREQARQVRSAAELLADAALSMDLPPTATPAQIIGAIATRPLVTPRRLLCCETWGMRNDGAPAQSYRVAKQPDDRHCPAHRPRGGKRREGAGIDPPPRMSFEDRLDQCLQGAMANPKAVSIEIYRVLYAMRRREPEPGSLSQT